MIALESFMPLPLDVMEAPTPLTATLSFLTLYITIWWVSFWEILRLGFRCPFPLKGLENGQSDNHLSGLAKLLMEETMKEVSAGFLDGPFLESDITERLGRADWSMSQRFLLLQGEDLKPRVIDNYEMSGVNAAFGTSSHLDLHDTDVVSCFLAFALGVFCGDHISTWNFLQVTTSLVEGTLTTTESLCCWAGAST